jgi:hypothetical protein
VSVDGSFRHDYSDIGFVDAQRRDADSDSPRRSFAAYRSPIICGSYCRAFSGLYVVANTLLVLHPLCVMAPGRSARKCAARRGIQTRC